MPRDLSRGPVERRPDHPERLRVHRHPRRLGHRHASWRRSRRPWPSPSPTNTTRSRCGSPHRSDPFVMTPHGPYMGIEGQASYEIEFDTFKYINEVERAESPPAGAPRLVKKADERLQATAAQSGPRRPHGCRPRGGELRVGRHGGSLLPDGSALHHRPGVQSNARESLRRYFGEWVLQDDRFTEYQGQEPACRGVLLLHGPGIGSWGELGDAGKFSENLYSSLWSYAHYTGDIGTVKARWDLVKSSTSPRSSPGGKGSVATASRRWATRPRRRSTMRVSRGWPATSTPTTTSATSPLASCCTSSSSRTARSTSARISPTTSTSRRRAGAPSSRSREGLPLDPLRRPPGMAGGRPAYPASMASGSTEPVGAVLEPCSGTVLP